jgi:hypothetical protein
MHPKRGGSFRSGFVFLGIGPETNSYEHGNGLAVSKEQGYFSMEFLSSGGPPVN